MRFPNLKNIKIRRVAMTRKRVVIFGASLVGLLVIFGAYALIVPAQQTSNYKKIVTRDQPELDSMVTDASYFLTSDVYLKSDVSAEQAKTDITNAREAVSSAQNQLDSVSGMLVDFKPAPGLGWSSKYKHAKEVRENELQYVSVANEYLKELTGAIDYTEATYDLSDGMTGAAKEMITAIQADNKADAVKHINEATSQLQTAADKYSNVKTTKTTKAMHDYMVSSLKQRVAYLKDFSNAVASGNPDKINASYGKLIELTTESAKKEDDLRADWVRNSPLTTLGSALDALEQKITIETPKL